MITQLLLLAAVSAPQSPTPGFTLFSPLKSTSTYLLDNSGTIVHAWPGNFTPGLSAYMDEYGDIIRTMLTNGQGAGSGGGIQRVAWDGTVLWDWRYDSNGVLSHHDIHVMPNGNILMLAWEDHTEADAIANGKDPSFVSGVTDVFKSETIIEVEPTGPTTGNIVWKWDAWDHLIQDFDPAQANYGVVADHPELIDINQPPLEQLWNGDWVHANSIHYNPALDQIIVSANRFNEIWIIDHSTTTDEAAGHTGGDAGRGGDLLYRWGNPQAYDHGTEADRVLFKQHDANWIEPDHPGHGDLMIFNNGDERTPEFSEVLQITPPLEADKTYTYTAGVPYGPTTTSWSYVDPVNPTDFFSSLYSGAERQANGNTIICDGQDGFFFEVDDQGNTVWTYQNALPDPGRPAVSKVFRYQFYLFAKERELSAGSGGQVQFMLAGGADNAGRGYMLIGGASGTEPGTPLPGGSETIPINQDTVSDHILANLNNSNFIDFSGTLDSVGNATATLDTLGPITPALIGQDLHFAFTTTGPYDFTSNAIAIEVVP